MSVVRQVEATVVIPLRHRVLRTGRPLASAHLDDDELPTTQHFALFVDESEVTPLAVLSLFSKSPEGAMTSFLQLRGMAVSASCQKQGLGTTLLKSVLATIPKQNVWCNARTAAVPFYTRIGFIVEGEAFVIPHVGEHFQMRLMR